MATKKKTEGTNKAIPENLKEGLKKLFIGDVDGTFGEHYEVAIRFNAELVLYVVFDVNDGLYGVVEDEIQEEVHPWYATWDE